MATAPNIENYYIGKGTVEFKIDGQEAWRHLGNVPEFEFTPALEQLEHFSSMQGVRTKDRTVVVQKAATIRLVMEEWNVDNLALALLGGETFTDSQGRTAFEIFASNAISGELRFTGTNEVGPRWEFHYLKVDFIPQSAVNPLSEEWGQLEINAEVATVNGVFGYAALIGEETEEASEPPSA